MSTKSYVKAKDLSNIDIENMGDVISLFLKISYGAIPHFKKESIIQLIDMQIAPPE